MSRALTEIGVRKGWAVPDLREIWEYRDVLYFLARRDVQVRYRQTFFGVAWAILQPLLMMAVFSVFLGRLAGVPSDGVPYPLFVYAALVPWQFFSQSLGESSHSLIANERLISRVYFPRLLIPVSTLGAPLVDFAFAGLVLGAMMAIYGVAPRASMLAIPLLIVLAGLAALSVGLWLSALNVRYRDVRHTLTFLMQFWLFATPVAYPASLVPESWRLLYALNPMTGVVEGFRWALFGTPVDVAMMIGPSVAVVVILAAGGLAYFGRMQATFADEI